MKAPIVSFSLCLSLVACSHLAAPGQPPEVKKLDVEGTNLAYVEEGRGDTVLFVHGVAGDWRTWEALRPQIARTNHFVSYSRRYHIPNPPDGGGRPYTYAQHADDLVAFVRALHVGSVHVVGGAYGARVAAEAALKSPELFRSITMSEPAFIRPSQPADAAVADALFKDLAKIGVAGRAGDTRMAIVHMVDAVHGETGAWDRLPPLLQQRMLDNQQTIVPGVTAPPTPAPSCEQLGRLTMPVLVLHGERTVPGFKATTDRILECLPSSSARAVVPDAGHIWYLVNPKAGADHIVAFIARTRTTR